MTLRPSFIVHAAAAVSLGLFAVIEAAKCQVTPPEPPEEARVSNVPYRPSAAGPRYFGFISDLHLGVGRQRGGSWNPTEDFRWPKALEGFLNKLSEDGEERVDLVIVGDFLEMWQPPPEIPCRGAGPELGCTLDEMAALSRIIASAHGDALTSLRAFAERGENRLHIMPGNHDSTIRYQAVWQPIGDALHADSGRIDLVTSGIWSSQDGRIVAARHLRQRMQQIGGVRVFIYGHTHQYEYPRAVELNDLYSVTVANTGAFQRLIDEPGFLRRLNGRPPGEGLRTIALEQLAPCYTAVTISTSGAQPQVRAWHMPEDGAGVFVLPSDARCR
jgi:UDP-2,3-diacylglucosamine pyrophosphatase LpxH